MKYSKSWWWKCPHTLSNIPWGGGVHNYPQLRSNSLEFESICLSCLFVSVFSCVFAFSVAFILLSLMLWLPVYVFLPGCLWWTTLGPSVYFFTQCSRRHVQSLILNSYVIYSREQLQDQVLQDFSRNNYCFALFRRNSITHASQCMPTAQTTGSAPYPPSHCRLYHLYLLPLPLLLSLSHLLSLSVCMRWWQEAQ